MKKKGIQIGIGIGIYLVALIVTYLLAVPRINFQSVGFYVFILIFFIIPTGALFLVLTRKRKIEKLKEKGIYTKTKKRLKVNGNKVEYETKIVSIDESYNVGSCILASAGINILGFVALMLIFACTSAKLFRAKSYHNQLKIEEGTQEEFSNTFNFENEDVLLPVIDKELSFKLAQSKIGDYGSQYEIDDEYFTLLSVTRNSKTELVRVTPIEYTNVFVSLGQKNTGTVGYIEVNVVTKEAKLVEVDGGMKYLPSAVFDKDLDRHIKMSYPTEIYYDKYFEIDDDGNPYWVVPTVKKEIGVFGGNNKKGVIIVNPVTGATERYNLGEQPEWVDRAIYDVMLETQATNALKYKNGFFNATFSKKDVFQVSDGYNYFINGGDTYYVSCITSPNEADQTSVGFITINLRTGQAKRYSMGGITEMRAREIAMKDERVKAQELDSTWPILIDYEGVPTYFLVLKNDVQEQKIVLINMQNGSLVAMGDTINDVKKEYDKLLTTSGDIEANELEITSIITKIRDLVDTKEFMVADIEDKYFVVDVSINLDARFIDLNDAVKIKYEEYSNYNLVTNIEVIELL